jgi:transposase
MSMKKAKDSALEAGSDSLDRNMLLGFSSEYRRIIDVADRECPLLPEPKVKRRGRRKKGRERSLIERLRDNEDSICLFVRDFRVPFDNNQAERDVRNVKTKVKVSGCFRSEGGASNYVELMSYLSTCRKHGIGVYEAYLSAFRGDPIMFQSTP